MAVNSYLIYEKLDKCLAHKLTSCRTECAIKYVTIYNPLISVKSNTVYIIVDKKHFPLENTGESCLMIVLGKISEDLLQATHHECICVDAEYSLGRLYEKLHEILEYYSSWEENLAQILLRDGTLNEICSASVPYFRNPLTVHSGNFEIIGVGETEDIKYPYPFREGDSDYLSDAWIKSALADAEKVFKTLEPFEFNYIPEHSSLLYNIFEGKRYKAQICVDANHSPLVPEDYIRICILARYVFQFLQKEAAANYVPKDRFRSQLIDYVAGRKKNQAFLSVSIAKHSWEKNDNYICCIARGEGSPVSDISLEYFCQKWEPELGECIIFGANSLIYILLNQREQTELSVRQTRILEEISLEYSLLLGVSKTFSDFFFCRDYFVQAAEAIKIGRKCLKEASVFKFEQFSLRYVVKYGLHSLPLYTIIPDGLRALIQYDRHNASDYYKTLEVYLRNNQNVTETINQLYMHRSTFKYRLQKIKEIMQTDLEDRNEQLYMELFFLELGDKMLCNRV